MLFAHGADNPERAAHQFQLLCRILAQERQHGAAVRTAGFYRLQAVFVKRQGFGERLARAGLAQRARHRRVVHASDALVAVLLHGGEPGFYLCDALCHLFRAAGEVHAAQLIQLRLQVVNLALARSQSGLKGQ